MAEEYDPLAGVQAAGPPGTISLVYGLPDPRTFPVEDLRRCADQALRERPALALQYGPQQGYGPLIDCLRSRLAREEGLTVERAQIALTGGVTAALDHLCTLFTRPGDRVLVEAPTYHEALGVLRDHGLSPVQVPIDNGGLQVEALVSRLEELARESSRARLLYTIPSFQNPSGITLSADRRQAILELAERFDLLVIEDDIYRDLSYEGRVPPSLFQLDASQRVVRLGSFSKILAPGLRMGWMLSAPKWIRRVVDSGLRDMGGGPTPLVAHLLAAYCERGLLEPHIERLRAIYRERRDVALAALQAHLPAPVHWTRPGGGFFVWLTLPTPLRARKVQEALLTAGIMLPAGDPFFAEAPTGQCLRLAFSYVTPKQIQQGIETLGRVLRSEI